jgi:hypothetical protein
MKAFGPEVGWGPVSGKALRVMEVGWGPVPGEALRATEVGWGIGFKNTQQYRY